jgi:4-amino-4-deoxy-L-arabinose transferase-like glycosyltransferase
MVLKRIPQIGDARDRALWALNFWACVIPAIILFLLVRAVGDRLAPGTGLISAISLGIGTMVLPFATMYFSHIPAAAASFAAFAVLVRERNGPFRPSVVLAAGVLSGVAVVFEYPSALIVLVLLGYVLCQQPRLPRGVTYAVGALAGVLPVIVYQWLVFGSPLHTPYDDVVAVPGASGHDVVRSNGEGILGVATPRVSNAISLLIGVKNYLLIQLPVILISHSIGLWLFYIQHQFDDVSWERDEKWDYKTAAIHGSSFLKLPTVFQWFTGNIGFHHVHHLSSRIPNYNLARCHYENDLFKEIRPITLLATFKSLKLHLWDEANERMISFKYLGKTYG